MANDIEDAIRECEAALAAGVEIVSPTYRVAEPTLRIRQYWPSLGETQALATIVELASSPALGDASPADLRTCLQDIAELAYGSLLHNGRLDDGSPS